MLFSVSINFGLKRYRVCRFYLDFLLNEQVNFVAFLCSDEKNCCVSLTLVLLNRCRLRGIEIHMYDCQILAKSIFAWFLFMFSLWQWRSPMVMGMYAEYTLTLNLDWVDESEESGNAIHGIVSANIFQNWVQQIFASTTRRIDGARTQQHRDLMEMRMLNAFM